MFGVFAVEDFRLLTTYKILVARRETSYHNDYAVDERGYILLSTTRKMVGLRWHRSDINLNNVLVYRKATRLIYGSGREEDCNYYYYAINWESGETATRFLLGDDKGFDDPGNANVIGPGRSIVYNSRHCLVRIKPVN